MKCNIGLLSDFEDYDPHYYYTEDWTGVRGVACPDKNEMWVFVDQIAFYTTDNKNLILRLSLTVIHELIHLCGVLDENMAYNGELAVYDGM
jgi:predicted Zn-dependent protease with MMP-like domain